MNRALFLPSLFFLSLAEQRQKSRCAICMPAVAGALKVHEEKADQRSKKVPQGLREPLF